MRENRTSGTVRGVPGDRHSYRDPDCSNTLKDLDLQQSKAPPDSRRGDFAFAQKVGSWWVQLFQGLTCVRYSRDRELGRFSSSAGSLDHQIDVSRQ